MLNSLGGCLLVVSGFSLAGEKTGLSAAGCLNVLLQAPFFYAFPLFFVLFVLRRGRRALFGAVGPHSDQVPVFNSHRIGESDRFPKLFVREALICLRATTGNLSLKMARITGFLKIHQKKTDFQY